MAQLTQRQMLLTMIPQHQTLEVSPAHLLIFDGGDRVVSGGSLGGVGAGVDPGRARVPKPTDTLQPLRIRNLVKALKSYTPQASAPTTTSSAKFLMPSVISEPKIAC